MVLLCSVDQEIPQLQFLYEVIDAPVVQVVFLAGCRARQMPMVLTLRIPLWCRRCSSCAVVDVAVLMQRCDPAVGPDNWVAR